MSRKIIFAIVVLAVIGLSLIEHNLKENGVIAQQEDAIPVTLYGPTILFETSEDSNLMTWKDVNKDIQYYTVYRKILGDRDFQYLHRIEADFDSGHTYRFRDTSIDPDRYYLYEVVATTGSGDLYCMLINRPARTQQTP